MNVTKETLKSVTNNRPIREYHLIISLFHIEGTINSRFLLSLGNDTDNLTVWTPNHFVSGRSLSAQDVVGINEKDIDIGRKRKVEESLSNIYWKRFIKEYIPLFNVRKKMK